MTPGDFNGDSIVDGADLALWKAGFGTTANATRTQGDADGDLDVDGADFLVWQRQVGSGPNSTGAAIPEPTALVILATGVLAIFSRRSDLQEKNDELAGLDGVWIADVFARRGAG